MGVQGRKEGAGWGLEVKLTHLYRFPPLSLNVATVNASAHVFHDDGAGTAVYEDTVGRQAYSSFSSV